MIPVLKYDSYRRLRFIKEVLYILTDILNATNDESNK